MLAGVAVALALEDAGFGNCVTADNCFFVTIAMTATTISRLIRLKIMRIFYVSSPV
jgi:hypothetical protein